MGKETYFTEEIATEMGLTWGMSRIWVWKVEKTGKGIEFFSTNIYLLLDLSSSFDVAELAITICFLAFCEVSRHFDSFLVRRWWWEKGLSYSVKSGSCTPKLLPMELHSPVAAEKGNTFIHFYHNSLVLTLLVNLPYLKC